MGHLFDKIIKAMASLFLKKNNETATLMSYLNAILTHINIANVNEKSTTRHNRQSNSIIVRSGPDGGISY